MVFKTWDLNFGELGDFTVSEGHEHPLVIINAIVSKVYHGLIYFNSHKGTKVNGYLDHQWHDHINIVKDGQL
jgi:hypothetical protein